MVNTKIEAQAQALLDNLNIRLATATKPMPVTKSYTAGKGLYLEVLLGSARPCAVISFESVSSPASGAKDALGLDQRVFSPHLLKIGFDSGSRAVATATAASVVGGVRAKTTITLTGAVATKTLTLNGSVFTAVAGAAANATQFSVAGDDAADATALASAINHSVDVLVRDLIVATAVGNVVTVESVAPGTAANAYGCVSNDASMVCAAATLVGGVTPDKVTIDGHDFVAMAVNQTLATDQFLVGVSDAACAANLAQAINSSVTTGISGVVTAAVDPTVSAQVNITAVVSGVAGNTLTLTETGGTFTVVSFATGANGTVDLLTQVHILAEAARIGMSVYVYQKSGIGVADLVQGNLVGVYQDLTWGQAASV